VGVVVGLHVDLEQDETAVAEGVVLVAGGYFDPRGVAGSGVVLQANFEEVRDVHGVAEVGSFD